MGGAKKIMGLATGLMVGRGSEGGGGKSGRRKVHGTIIHSVETPRQLSWRGGGEKSPYKTEHGKEDNKKKGKPRQTPK